MKRGTSSSEAYAIVIISACFVATASTTFRCAALARGRRPLWTTSCGERLRSSLSHRRRASVRTTSVRTTLLFLAEIKTKATMSRACLSFVPEKRGNSFQAVSLILLSPPEGNVRPLLHQAGTPSPSCSEHSEHNATSRGQHTVWRYGLMSCITREKCSKPEPKSFQMLY